MATGRPAWPESRRRGNPHRRTKRKTMKIRMIGRILWMAAAVVIFCGAIRMAAASGATGPAAGTGAVQWRASGGAQPAVAMAWLGADVRTRIWNILGKARLLALGICHLLLAWWVYTDTNRRAVKEGPQPEAWVWVAVTLLGGFLGAAVYALIRMGDRRE